MATVSFMLPDEFHSAIIQHKRAWWSCPASACQVGLARDQQYWGADVLHSTTLACLPVWDLICALLVYDSGGIVVHIWHLASLGVSNAKIKPSHSWDNPTHSIRDICIELSGDRRDLAGHQSSRLDFPCMGGGMSLDHGHPDLSEHRG